MRSTIPEKRYFRIGEVAKLAAIPPHVLRYWENEFKEIKPRRAGSKHRLYTREDVEIILQIRILLKEQGLTVAGARRVLRRNSINSEVLSPKYSHGVKDVISQNKRVVWQPFLPMMEELVIASHNKEMDGTLSVRQRLALLKQSLIELRGYVEARGNE